MRRIVFILCLLWGACVAAYAQDGFKITGTLGRNLGGKLVLVGNGAEGAVSLGETVMIDGDFEFTGKVDGMILAYILTEERQPVATLMLENLEYLLVAGENGIEVQGGGDSQKVLNEFEAVNRRITREKMLVEQQMKAAYAQQNQMQLQALQQQFSKVMQEAGEKQAELLKTYKDSPVSAFIVASGMGQMDYVSLQTVFDELGEPARNSLFGQMIVQCLAAMKDVEIGAIAPNFKGSMVNNDTLSLYGVKAKLKLVDFWASWCAPCRQEMPNVCKVYKKYHDKGLEIIGVSLDSKILDWQQAMVVEKMKWLNIVDAQQQIATRYFVRGIPHTLLLDENNRIIAKNLRGKTLEKKIAELLGDK